MTEQLSNYEIILTLDEAHSLLVNGLYGAIDVVDAKEGKALLSGHFRDLSKEERARLLARGHLTEDLETETEDLTIFAGIYRKLFAESEMQLLLLPTYDCNFRCPYCFERHRLSKGEEWLCESMSKAMVDAVFRAVEKERDRGVQVKHLTLYGGEPFLKENKELVTYIAKKAMDAGLTLGAVTNGYDLDSYMDVLTDYPFRSLQITLDGLREENDKRRVHVGGGGSFDQILKNTELAVSKGIKVSLRVNTGPENLERVHLMKGVFEERGLEGNPKFSFYYAATSGENYPGKEYGVTHRQIVENLERNGFSRKEAMKYVSHYNTFTGRIRKQIESQEYFRASDSHCGSEKMMYLVDPRGSVYTCWDFVAMEDFRVGRIDMEKGKFAFNFSLLTWNFRNVLQMPECKRCPYVFFCSGGCAACAYRETGDLSNPYCGEVKEIFRDSVTEVCREEFEKTGNKELTKSLKEEALKYTKEERNILLHSRNPQEILGVIKNTELNIFDTREEQDG